MPEMLPRGGGGGGEGEGSGGGGGRRRRGGNWMLSSPFYQICRHIKSYSNDIRFHIVCLRPDADAVSDLRRTAFRQFVGNDFGSESKPKCWFVFLQFITTVNLDYITHTVLGR